MLFKGTKQTTHGLNHEDDDGEHYKETINTMTWLLSSMHK
jgi:hypothetical protein